MEKRYQHGDVILVKVNDVPKNLVWKQVKKGFVVERGEGVHTHTMIDDCEIAEKDGVLYFRDLQNHQFGVDHEEHHVKILEPGIYKKEIENEFDYEDMEARKTRD